MKELKDLCRANIWNLAPYSCARTEFSGKSASVFLDANENPYNEPFNRYPDTFQTEVKVALSKIKNVPVENIFLGNGSDEAIDLVYRVFCNPGIDNVVAIAPTYGMYEVCADVNDVEYRSVLLDEQFQITAEKLLALMADSVWKFATCPRACTPASVLPLAEISMGSPHILVSSVSIFPWIVLSVEVCFCHP